MKNNPTENNRAQILQVLLDKSVLKQDISNDSEKVFALLKAHIKIELAELQKSVTDKRVRLSFHEKGEAEIHVYVGSDVLVFTLHSNVFRLPDSNALWGTSYFKEDENHGYFGVIYIYNFLAQSFLQNRLNDSGYLIGRILINHERHFLVEGKGTLGRLFQDPQNMELNEQIIGLIVQLSFHYALTFDLLVPPFEVMEELSVSQIQQIGDELKLKTAKRLGFKRSSEESENI
ncbi:MAG: hypothetical protein K9I37_04480 [Crocinitomicaceae bacterium]|jgi:hypothetical protein|nr:hypothetical protein [Crocinitomicaceae bacterium]